MSFNLFANIFFCVLNHRLVPKSVLIRFQIKAHCHLYGVMMLNFRRKGVCARLCTWAVTVCMGRWRAVCLRLPVSRWRAVCVTMCLSRWELCVSDCSWVVEGRCVWHCVHKQVKSYVCVCACVYVCVHMHARACAWACMHTKCVCKDVGLCKVHL